jgi:outer membrane lipoprotein carrier protein
MLRILPFALLPFGTFYCLLLLAQAAAPVAVPPTAPAAEPAPAFDTPAALALAAKVQGFYEKTKDFTADFEQRYVYSDDRRTHSTGTLRVRKPGDMRWDYKTPEERMMLLNGDANTLYLYNPDDKEVQVKKNFSANAMSAAVTFLWGRGKLTDSFHIAVVSRPKFGDTVLELEPKGDQEGVKRIFFALDGQSGAVQKSLIIDTGDNENRIVFSNPELNQGLEKKLFKFDKPRGVHESALP